MTKSVCTFNYHENACGFYAVSSKPLLRLARIDLVHESEPFDAHQLLSFSTRERHDEPNLVFDPADPAFVSSGVSFGDFISLWCFDTKLSFPFGSGGTILDPLEGSLRA